MRDIRMVQKNGNMPLGLSRGRRKKALAADNRTIMAGHSTQREKIKPLMHMLHSETS